MALPIAQLHEAIATILDEFASMLEGEHAALADRTRRARAELLEEPGKDIPDSTVRMLRRLRSGTMGALSDVTFGALVNGRWVVDDVRERRFRELSRDFRTQLSSLPSSSAPDLYLVTDRVRECWLIDPESMDQESRTVEVQPPIWTGSATTCEWVVLHGSIGESGGTVEITVGREPGSGRHMAAPTASSVVDLGRGRVFSTRDAAEAAAEMH